MPPKSKPRPPEKDLRALTEWIGGRAEAAAARRAAEGRTVLRRLNRVEYENTVRELLGVEVDLQEMLPPDTAAHGFDNVGEALHVSSFLMEKYLDAAEAALNVAIANGPRPPAIKKRCSFKDERHVKLTTERVFRKRDDALVFFSSSAWQGVTLSQFYPPDRGRYRFRISAYAVQSAGKPVTFRVDAGPMLMATKNHLVGYFDVPSPDPERPTVVEFVDRLEARSTIRLLPYGLASAQAVHKVGADDYQGPGLAVQWVEVEGPLHDTWPPESHRRIFGDLPQAVAPVYNKPNRVEVVSKSPDADAERILRAFARRAFRRAVTADDVKPFVTLVKARLAQKHSFEQAVRVGFIAVMVSPEFLFLREKVGAASRAAPITGPARLAGPAGSPMIRKPDTIAFWRGHLPHWEVAEGRYFVTIHLAGAIPQQGRDRIHALAAEHDKLAEHDAEGRLRLQRRIYAEMESWLDRAEYVSHLQRPNIARTVIEAIRFRHGRTWNVLEYVVMPSHLHLFLEVLDGGLKNSLEQFKRWTGHQAAKCLDSDKQRFWQDEWLDHWSRSDEEDEKFIAYIRRNPVKANLVENFQDWPYGSWSNRQ